MSLFKLKNLKKLPAIALAISTLDDMGKVLPGWVQTIVDITEKPEFTGGIATVSLIAYLAVGGSNKVYICKNPAQGDKDIKYASSTFSYFDIGILGATVGTSIYAKYCPEFYDKYYQLVLTGISVFDFICDVTTLSNCGTTETISDPETGNIIYEIHYA